MTDGLEAAREAYSAFVRASHPQAAEDANYRWWWVEGARWALNERAGELALRAAAKELKAVWEEPLDPRVDESETDPQLRFAARWQQYERLDDATQKLIAALEGAPWEPSEEMVERMAAAAWEAHETFNAPPSEMVRWSGLLSRGTKDEYRIMARAALKAAMGVDSGSAG